MSSLTTTLRDLGAPTILGAVVGAYLGAKAQARGRDVEYERALELLAIETERQAAREADAALAAMRRVVFEPTTQVSDLTRRFFDAVAVPTAQLRNTEAALRISQLSALLVLALQRAHETLWQFSVDLAIEDAQNSLQALLKREPAMTARMPDEEHMRALLVETNDDGQGFRFEPLNQWIVGHWPGDDPRPRLLHESAHHRPRT